MGQVTIYLDAETESKLRRVTSKKNISRSKWIARIIADHLDDDWPEDVADLAGSWSDFPDLESIRSDLVRDIPRESF
jgi:hypothetical protein